MEIQVLKTCFRGIYSFSALSENIANLQTADQTVPDWLNIDWWNKSNGPSSTHRYSVQRGQQDIYWTSARTFCCFQYI